MKLTIGSLGLDGGLAFGRHCALGLAIKLNRRWGLLVKVENNPKIWDGQFRVRLRRDRNCKGGKAG